MAFTDAAADLVRRLSAEHGPVMFHQSGGCCDGSSPMCYPRASSSWAAATCGWARWPSPDSTGRSTSGCRSRSSSTGSTPTSRSTSCPGGGGGFSLESPEGVRFLLRSRLFTDDEEASLVPVLGGDEVEDLD
ncbi:DUF779 domain-containing protein [Aquihabitans sp. G128]|nr:DUF779 domain-containing protein [Aquihabitans sp. G128]